MSEHDSDDDEPTLKEIRDREELTETLGWEGAHVEEDREQWQDEVDLLKERAELEEAKQRLTGVARERAEAKIEELDEVIRAPVEAEIQERREKADHLEKQAESLAEREGWADAAERAKKKAAELRDQAETLEAKLEGENAETMSDSDSTTWKINVPKAVKRLKSNMQDNSVLSTEFGSVEKQAKEHRERAETLESKGESDRAADRRAGAEILEARLDGKTTIRLEGDRYSPPAWTMKGKDAERV